MELWFMEETQTLEIKQEIQYTNQDESFNLPEFLYHVVYAENIMSIKKEGIKPHLTQSAYSDYVQDCLFLSADQKTKLKVLEDAEKLRPAIGQAHALELLAPPANAAGPRGPGAGGPGPRHFGNRPE